MKQLLVDHQREVDIQNDAIVDGQADDNADQPELGFQALRQHVEPKCPGLVSVSEHAEVLVEEVSYKNLEELLGDTAFILYISQLYVQQQPWAPLAVLRWLLVFRARSSWRLSRPCTSLKVFLPGTPSPHF